MKTSQNRFSNVDLKMPKPAAELSNAKQRVERNGKVMMPFWVPLAARIQLRVTAAEEDTTQQELMIEGLNHVFKTRGKPPIA